MKINVLFFLIFSISLSSIAQTPEKIKNNSDYIWGESTASTLEQADQFALKDLISQISTNVESSFSNIITEINESIEEYTQSAINTYSNIYLKNAKRIVVEKRKQIYVLRYIEKDEVDKMFESRKNKIIDYTKLADMAEKDSRIGDALRYYYWALVLLNSHPDAAMIKYTTAENIEIGILLYIQNQFDKIFDNLRINVADTINCNNTVSYTLDINYKGQAVANLDYVYWNGTEFSNTYSIKDGLGVVDFFNSESNKLDNLHLKLEYTYFGRSHIDPEVKSVLEMASLPRLKKAEVSISLTQPELKIKKINEKQLVYNKMITIDTISSNLFDINGEIKATLSIVNQWIVNKSQKIDETLFTKQGLDSYNKLIKYGDARILSQKGKIDYIRINDEIMVRSFPMIFSFPNNNKAFVEDIVYLFNSEGKISNISFALSDGAITDIMEKSERFASLEEKYFLINFLENYKTAYSLEDISFIENVFSDDALIIVGTVLQKYESVDGTIPKMENQNIKYVRYSKEQYINHLIKAFDSKEYINLEFEDNVINKTGGEDKIYGIQITQNYYSSNYSDKGYLFLMLDLNDISEPKIYVRTWQPDKNDDGSIFGLEHFSIK
ncbi:MAG: hypothetical protein PHH30_03220 [Bacteroidales bacterium]|nr:hypothetical protein [Bacteroidales bacterium]